MKIAVFTRTRLCGGSEIRAVEICNAIARHTPHQPFLLSETAIPRALRRMVAAGVTVVEEVFGAPGAFELFYEMDSVVVVNTNARDYTMPDFWTGRTNRHRRRIDLGRVRQLTFLFNFVLEPARRLAELEAACRDIRIIVANPSFLDRISGGEEYARIAHLPRMFLESPIDPDSVTAKKAAGPKIRVGRHSRPLAVKFNSEHGKLVDSVNAVRGDVIEWDFMGVPRPALLGPFPNVTCRPAFSMPVSAYLEGIHVFLFFPAWDRKEAWSRCVAEAMMSGCPILATDAEGGNRAQVVHGHNGYLCGSVGEFAERICELGASRETIDAMGQNSRRLAQSFASEQVITRLIGFIGGPRASH